MAVAKITLEGATQIKGDAQITLTEVVCICGKCGNTDRENATIEFNFREEKVFYTCSKCHKINEMTFGKQLPSPLPRSRVR